LLVISKNSGQFNFSLENKEEKNWVSLVCKPSIKARVATTSEKMRKYISNALALTQSNELTTLIC